MDYEKKYNDALELVKKFMDEHPTRAEQDLMVCLFPELKESEVEKAAYDYALRVDMGTCGELVVPAFIAGAKWQEKQDQETIALAEDHAMLAGRMQMKEEMEKIMESDPDAIEKTPKQDYSGLNDFERAIHRGFLCAGVENVPVSIIKQTEHEALAHIEKEEWSEEDEKVYEYLRSGFEYAYDPKTLNNTLWGGNNATIQDYRNFVNKLNSLRPQPHWRPSEEQMKELYAAAREAPIVKESGNYLYDLYNDLSKL